MVVYVQIMMLSFLLTSYGIHKARTGCISVQYQYRPRDLHSAVHFCFNILGHRSINKAQYHIHSVDLDHLRTNSVPCDSVHESAKPTPELARDVFLLLFQRVVIGSKQELDPGGGSHIWFGQGCATRASKPLPILKGHFGRKGYSC